MTVSSRARVFAGLFTTIVIVTLAAAVVVFIGGRSDGHGASGGDSADPGGTSSPPPTICPLTDTRPSGGVPMRPALAVKVENLPAARPQTGLSWADIVYEEPVEANITRFIAIYQCQDASRIEPVRSARLSDPPILVQYGRPLFAYAGGVPQVVQKIRQARLVDVNFNTQSAADAYHRDSSRVAPHNLYTSTKELYGSVRHPTGIPQPVFTYSRHLPAPARPASEAHIPFSGDSDVFWRWDGGRKKFLRWHGSVPHTLSDGTQVSARNVVIQMVKVVTTTIHDANGVFSPEVVSVGTGKAYVLRNGKVVSGSWKRASQGERTKFYDSTGKEIPLAPGNTWVELVPQSITVTIQ
jgi:hypothetical protein